MAPFASATWQTGNTKVSRVGCKCITVVACVVLLHLAVLLVARHYSALIYPATISVLHMLEQHGDDAEETLPPNVLASVAKFTNRSVNIKVGVFNVEQRKANETWIEFDPTVAQQSTGNQLILPFIAAPFSAPSMTFYLLAKGACSSVLLPSGTAKDPQAYRQAGVAMCNKALKTMPTASWNLWDRSYPDKESYRASFEEGADGCYHCQDITAVREVRQYTAIALSSVISHFRKVELLDMDAQGLDVAILLTLRRYFSRINTIRLECQALTTTFPTWLYEAELNGKLVSPNDCNIAQSTLEQYGYACKQQVNNCACEEKNLICSKV